jgi:hypothetical protein
MDGLDDELVFDGPLDEHPIAATATTTATTPHRVPGKRIRSTLRATPTANDAPTPRSATVRLTGVADAAADLGDDVGSFVHFFADAPAAAKSKRLAPLASAELLGGHST